MKRKRITLLVIAVITTFFACNLFADYDPTVNPLDPGQEIISITNLLNGRIFQGVLDYDVYAPGEFQRTISQSTGSIDGLYVYEYQITSTQGYGDNLSIAIDPGAGAANFGFAGSAPDVAPVLIFNAGDQVSYSFAIAAGQSTVSLVFTSPYGPTAGDAVVHGMLAGSQDVVVPVPVPEPITLILLGAGCLPLRYYRKRSR